ncbi:rhodanese-like domain-containing protein [Moraxella sp. ZY210820]|uniref:rhodanese-like domain-containing protein n=1 Tax=unclassified Moraxella TaxID=2685852 RepID=UPI00272FD2BD|nr:rhodanese-like domain-containing protein [Moraxella sp. ZY210820]WLF83546.1 rhodanese-like domain-containing protein [Moraxella sp. ZY210820]
MIRKQDITSFDFPEHAVIWDVREPTSYQEGHIMGAVNRPFNTLTAESLNDIDPAQPIYILCGGGSKAPRSAELLDSFDSQREYVVLMGGTRAAKEAGMTIIQGE